MVCTRLDIAFTVSCLATFFLSSRAVHWERCLQSTNNWERTNASLKPRGNLSTEHVHELLEWTHASLNPCGNVSTSYWERTSIRPSWHRVYRAWARASRKGRMRRSTLVVTWLQSASTSYWERTNVALDPRGNVSAEHELLGKGECVTGPSWQCVYRAGPQATGKGRTRHSTLAAMSTKHAHKLWESTIVSLDPCGNVSTEHKLLGKDECATRPLWQRVYRYTAGTERYALCLTCNTAGTERGGAC